MAAPTPVAVSPFIKVIFKHLAKINLENYFENVPLVCIQHFNYKNSILMSRNSKKLIFNLFVVCLYDLTYFINFKKNNFINIFTIFSSVGGLCCWRGLLTDLLGKLL